MQMWKKKLRQIPHQTINLLLAQVQMSLQNGPSSLKQLEAERLNQNTFRNTIARFLYLPAVQFYFVFLCIFQDEVGGGKCSR